MTAGVNDRFDFSAPVPPAEELGPVHFIAIGGSGMSGVARLFLARGIEVSGSDGADSRSLRELADLGARVHVGHDAGQLGAARTVVVSSAIRESNPELAAARAAGLRVLHRSQGIAALLGDRDAVAVAGANGKTTTSGMLTAALQSAGADPTYVIGSALADSGLSSAPGTGSAFVVEADESDGSFVVYHPLVAVVTNIRPDHLDFYGDLATIERAYERFAATVRPGGLLVVCADDPGARALGEHHAGQGGRVVSYGLAADADVRLTDPVAEGMASRAGLVHGDQSFDLVVPMPGRHNLLNAAGAYAAAVAGLGASPERVVAGLGAFPGTARRFQAVGRAGGVEVVDDYAHNPDKVAAVVQAGRAVAGSANGRRLVVVFQPHLYSRTRDFADAFAEGLAAADVVCVTDVYGAREDPLPGVTGDLIAEGLRARPPVDVHYLPDRSRVAEQVAALLQDGDLLLTVGAGDITGVGPQVLALLGEHGGHARAEPPGQSSEQGRTP